MALPSLPAAGANWSAWGAAVHDALNNPTPTPDATTAAKGLVELATTTEATTGTDTDRAVTPAGLKAVADTKVALSGANVLSGAQRINGQLALNAAPAARTPFNSVSVLNGPALASSGTGDIVGQLIQNVVTGDYTGVTATNPGYLWGANIFTATGSATGDGNGLTNLFGALIEASVRAPAGTTIGSVIGCMAEAAFMASAAAATVTNMISLKVGAPKRKDGATAGTATNAYGIYVEGAVPATVGSTTAYSIFVQSGASHFGGAVNVDGNLTVASGAINTSTARTVLDIYAGPATTDGARLTLRQNTVDGFAYLRLPQSGAKFYVTDGTTNNIEMRNTGVLISKSLTAQAVNATSPGVIARGFASQTGNVFIVQDSNTTELWAITAAGIPKWTAAVNQQTTVGAAGGASALPATPAKYLKVQDSAGTTYVIPAYTA